MLNTQEMLNYTVEVLSEAKSRSGIATVGIWSKIFVGWRLGSTRYYFPEVEKEGFLVFVEDTETKVDPYSQYKNRLMYACSPQISLEPDEFKVYVAAQIRKRIGEKFPENETLADFSKYL